MRALVFGLSVPRYLLGRSLGKITDAALFGSLSGLALAELPTPALPGPDWVGLEVIAGGICGSDLGTLTYKSSPALEPFASFPAVLGHEILARVARVGAAVTRVKVGDRVAVDPTISCLVRGRAPAEQCPSCVQGLSGTCSRSGEAGGPSPSGAPLARGFLIGAHKDLPGGLGEQLVAHQLQLHVIPDGLSDDAAVMTEPLSIGVHAVLQVGPEPTAPTLVIGSGPIALGTVWALKALGHTGPLVAQTRRSHEAALARALGATATVSPGPDARAALLATGATAYQPIIGPEVFAGGGFPLVFDCVGSRDSLDQALRYVAPRGRIVLLGCAAELRKLDLTFLWARELTVRGFLCYGTESWRDQRLHTFAVTHRLMIESAAPVAKLVTHSFPLADYRKGFAAAAHHAESGAVKVVLRPR